MLYCTAKPFLFRVKFPKYSAELVATEAQKGLWSRFFSFFFIFSSFTVILLFFPILVFLFYSCFFVFVCVWGWEGGGFYQYWSSFSLFLYFLVFYIDQFCFLLFIFCFRYSSFVSRHFYFFFGAPVWFSFIYFLKSLFNFLFFFCISYHFSNPFDVTFLLVVLVSASIFNVLNLKKLNENQMRKSS